MSTETTNSSKQDKPRPMVAPAVDIFENKDEVLLVADLPGVAKADLSINFDKGHLTIRDPQNPFLAPDALQGGQPFTLLASHTYFITYELRRKHLIFRDPPSGRSFTLADDTRTLAASEAFILGFPAELVHLRRGASRQRLERKVLELKAGRRKDLAITIRRDRFDD